MKSLQLKSLLGGMRGEHLRRMEGHLGLPAANLRRRPTWKQDQKGKGKGSFGHVDTRLSCTFIVSKCLGLCFTMLYQALGLFLLGVVAFGVSVVFLSFL